MSLVWTPTIKSTIARMPGHLVSFIDAKGILPQKRAQRYQIAPIAITPDARAILSTVEVAERMASELLVLLIFELKSQMR